jgi:predicted acetyltransferase
MDIQMRPCKPDELDRFLITCVAAFGEEMDEASRKRHLKVLDAERAIAAWDGDQMVGTGGNYTFELTVPGGSVPAAGVTLVGVLPTHRRRGILTRLMGALLDDAVARKEPVAILWASESNIYQRFGYGAATRQMRIEAARDRLVWLDSSPAVGTARMISEDEALKVLPGIYDRVQVSTPGTFVRSGEWWRYHRLPDPPEHRNGAGPMFRVVLEIDGVAEAYALYRIQPEWDYTPKSLLRVIEALGTTDRATREIWKFLSGIDLIQTIAAWGLPLDHPLPLMVAEPPRLGVTVRDGLWLRILDIEAALSARSYGSTDRLVLEVEDSFRPRNAGRWCLDAGGASPSVSRCDDEPDGALSINDLGALYLGAWSGTQLQAAGRLREMTTGAAARVDALFRYSRAAFCPEIF